MMRVIEGILFLALATAIHAGVWHLVPASTGAAASGGAGTDTMTLSAATPAQAAMVARWQQPPSVTAMAPDTPRQDASLSSAALAQAPLLADRSRPALPNAPTAPQLAGYPNNNTPPQMDTTSAARPQVQETVPKVRPKARRPAQKAQPPAAAQPDLRASGQARQAQRGTSGADQMQSQNSNQSNALRAKWGAQIHAKVQRSMRYPRGIKGSGTAKLALKVTPNGNLKALSVLRSSGNEILDKAAIQAVQRAGRFAKAPQELRNPVYAFSISLTFSR